MDVRSLFPLVLLVAVVACGSQERAPEGATDLDTGTPDAAMVSVGNLNVQTTVATYGRPSITRSLPGETHPSPDHFAVVSAPIGGRIARITAHEGDYVRQGQVLLELESIGFAEMVADYLQARANEDFYRTQEARMEMLVEKSISPQASLERARSELARAEVLVSSTYGRLRALDLTDERIAALQSNARARPLLPVLAPISGVIDEHLIDLGTSVQSYQELLTLVDARHVLVRAFADPEDVTQVSGGTPVRIGRRSDDDQSVSATVTTVGPALDAANKSLVLNILLESVDGFPIPGQTVRVELDLPGLTALVSVPAESVVYQGDQPSVFVARAQGTFELVPVAIERITGSTAYLRSGIQEGDRIAISEVFSLKALARYGEYAED